MNKLKVKMSNSVYLGLLILDKRKTAMYKYWYDCVKSKYGQKAKLYCMDTGKFVVHMKSENIYADLAVYVNRRSDTYNFKIKRSLPIGKCKTKIRLMKDE